MSLVEVWNETEKRARSKLSHKHCKDGRFHELQQQLEFAESRCGTLKQQLDYIKMLYKKSEKLHGKQEEAEKAAQGDGNDVGQMVVEVAVKWSDQNLICGGGEGDKCIAPLKPNSLTNTTRTSTNSSNKASCKSSCRQDLGEQKAPLRQRGHLKLTRVKKKHSNKSKSKMNYKASSRFCNASSQTQIWQDPLVEIYKNRAANNAESESGLETIKNKENKLEGSKTEKADADKPEINQKSTSVEESAQTEIKNDLFEAVKSYYQPTISSKRKQVERTVLNMSMRSIPFIAATSTAPSHNIGVNIQQVLSIIKKRQPASQANLSDVTRENSILSFFAPKTSKPIQGNESPADCESKKSVDVRSSMTHWGKERSVVSKESSVENEAERVDWSFRVGKLKKVLVFLHEDFSYLSQKYKRLQKRLTKRSINKNDAKGELTEIEKSLERKEEEITVVLGLYKEVMSLREELKKVQKKCNYVSSEKCFAESLNLNTSNSTHTEMMSLLRKIHNFQEQLKI